MKTSQQCWEFLNESFISYNSQTFKPHNHYLNGSELALYDVLINIEKAYINPNFDFGRMFDYKKQKWSSLVKNYVNLEELNRVKKAVQAREAKKQIRYTEGMAFYNNHKNGKGCLLSITFVKRHQKVILACVIRSSEITKRLMMDLLLIQRIGEEVYGNNDFGIQLFCHNMYQVAEFAVTYNIHKPIFRTPGSEEESVMKKSAKYYAENTDHYNKYTTKVANVFRKFMTIDISTVKYKVHRRSIRQLQTKKGKPISGCLPLKVKNLKIHN